MATARKARTRIVDEADLRIKPNPQLLLSQSAWRLWYFLELSAELNCRMTGRIA
jgi:hypothetical protein